MDAFQRPSEKHARNPSLPPPSGNNEHRISNLIGYSESQIKTICFDLYYFMPALCLCAAIYIHVSNFNARG